MVQTGSKNSNAIWRLVADLRIATVAKISINHVTNLTSIFFKSQRHLFIQILSARFALSRISEYLWFSNYNVGCPDFSPLIVSLLYHLTPIISPLHHFISIISPLYHFIPIISPLYHLIPLISHIISPQF